MWDDVGDLANRTFIYIHILNSCLTQISWINEINLKHQGVKRKTIE